MFKHMECSLPFGLVFMNIFLVCTYGLCNLVLQLCKKTNQETHKLGGQHKNLTDVHHQML